MHHCWWFSRKLQTPKIPIKWPFYYPFLSLILVCRWDMESDICDEKHFLIDLPRTYLWFAETLTAHTISWGNKHLPLCLSVFLSLQLCVSQTEFPADGPKLLTKFTTPWHIAAVSDQVSSSMRVIFHVQDIRFLVNFSCELAPVSVHPSCPDLQRGALPAAPGHEESD